MSDDMKIILEQPAVHDVNGATSIHYPAGQHSVPRAIGEALVARGVARVADKPNPKE